MQWEMYVMTAMQTAHLAKVVQLIALHVLQIIISFPWGIVLCVPSLKAIPSIETTLPHVFPAQQHYPTVFIVKGCQIMLNAHFAITTMATPII